MMVHFLVPEIDLGPRATRARLTARMTDGEPLFGIDAIKMVPRGDANMDGRVGSDDLSLTLANWGRETDWAGGEFSGVAPIDNDDLSLLLANWTDSGVSQVPGPATLLLLGLGSLLMPKRRS